MLKGLQLPPDVFEIVEAFFSGEPFGGADGAFGKAAARLGVVAEINAIGRGFENNFVQSDDFAFTERRDLQFFAAAAGFEHRLPDCYGSAGGCVFLGDVVAFEDLSAVVALKCCGGGASDVQKEVHADGKIGTVDETGAMVLDQGADAVEFLVPAGRADHHVLAGFDAGFNVGDDAVWCGEIDDRVDAAKGVRSERGSAGVFLSADGVHVMPAFGGDFCYQRSGFASAQYENIHPRRFNHRGHGGAQRLALGTVAEAGFIRMPQPARPRACPDTNHD